MSQLKDKIGLVTGASSGIGAACAFALAKEGMHLVLTARRESKLQEVKQHIQHAFPGIRIHCAILDVQDESSIQDFFQNLPYDFKDIDLLINNAGLALDLSPVQTGKTADWNAMIDTNIKGLLFMSRHCLEGMIERDSGHIINIGSIAGHEVYPGGVVYAATKHAVLAITKGLRMDLLPHPIRVTSIDPGAVETEFSVVRFKGDKTRADQVYKGWQPLTAEDVADAVIYAATRPPHVNVADLVLTSRDQASIAHIRKKT